MEIWKRLLLLALLLTPVAAGCGQQNEVGGESGNEGAGDRLSVPSATGSPGTAVILQLEENVQRLVEIDLSNGQLETLFTVPDNGWLADFAAAPQERAWVLSYAPPPPSGEIQYGYTGLYLLLLDQGPTLRLLSSTAGAQEIYFNPTWSHDGRHLAYAHIIPAAPEGDTFTTALEMVDLSTNAVTLLAADGLWPAFAPDGRSLAYVHIDPRNQANALHLLDLQNMEPRILVPPQRFDAVDAPFFSPDGSWIYFSAVSDSIGGDLSWWQLLLGLQTVAAHYLPSDWWRMPVSGGSPQRLTNLNAVGLAGRFTTAENILFVQREGLFQMSADGSQITALWSGTALDSIAWRP